MVKVLKHPIIEHHLTILRNKNTNNFDFRYSTNVISHFLAIDAFSELPLYQKKIDTPLEKFTGSEILSDIVLVPVLRAGLALLDAFQFMMPSAKISFIGLSRDEKDFSINEYYFSKPDFHEQTKFIILEMMIATGGSVCTAINRLQLEGASDFTVCSVIAAPEGIERIITEFPDVKIITAALDRELNANKYILPGLGDAGDRWCGV